MRYLAAAAALAVGLNFPSVAASSQSEPCARVASDMADYGRGPASIGLECLQSVPFNATIALQFIESYNNTVLQWQSTTAFLKNPPPSYQQAAVDLNGWLNDIKTAVMNGTYTNEYDFENDVAGLIQSAHDGHFSLYGMGASAALRFFPSLNIVSFSSDGKELPKVYVFEDLNETSYYDVDWVPSSIDQINGVDAADYLIDLGSFHKSGFLESNTEWNSLMWSPAARTSSPGANSLGSSRYIDDWFNLTFANGSEHTGRWMFRASGFVQASDWEGIEDGQDVFDAFVVSATVDTSAAATSGVSSSNRENPTRRSWEQPRDKSLGWSLDAYPAPDILQEGFGDSDSNAAATGYFIGELAVFSVPTFSMNGDDARTYSEFVADFISSAQAAGAKKVLFDLQENPGGTILLAYETFKHFFPANYPYSGSRGRYHNAANVLGEAFTLRWENDVSAQNSGDERHIAASAWVADTYLNAATGQPFQNWSELASPYTDNGDQFMNTELWDFNNPIVDLNGGGFILDGFANRSNDISNPQPFDIEDMVILTDGACSSTCSLFLELFKHQYGVKAVTVGGTPQNGPMQVVGGVRGAQAYDRSTLKANFDKIESQYSGDLHAPLPDINNTGIQLRDGGAFNLWDNIRENETFPQQFAYHAADCRIFFTADTWNNYTALWLYAADAIFNDESKCVDGSVGQPSAVRPYFTDTCGPSADDGCVQDDAMWGTANHTFFNETASGSSPTGIDDSSVGGVIVSDASTHHTVTNNHPNNTSAAPHDKMANGISIALVAAAAVAFNL